MTRPLGSEPGQRIMRNFQKFPAELDVGLQMATFTPFIPGVYENDPFPVGMIYRPVAGCC